MRKESYLLLETYMRSCMGDSAHDQEHVYRVLYNALEIAREEENIHYDVLISACLLHDIGRKEQFENPALCHAQVGAAKASRFLVENGFGTLFAQHVSDCIETHRFRKSKPPQSVEAKILFDADKLDATGAIGIARTLIYKGQVSEPLYSVDADGRVLDGAHDTEPSFFQEYKYKLEKLYSNFYTRKGMELANRRREAAVRIYEDLLREVNSSYGNGLRELAEHVK